MAVELVDKHIEDDETCVRCVLHPLMYSESNNKLKEQAFQPKWGEHDASLLRLRYSTVDFCRHHGEKLAVEGQTFVGLAFLTPIQVEKINNWAISEASTKKYDGENAEVNGIEAHIEYAPMNNGKYVDRNIDVYTERDIDLPMHADLKYAKAFDDDVKTRVRHYARQLAQIVKFEHK